MRVQRRDEILSQDYSSMEVPHVSAKTTEEPRGGRAWMERGACGVGGRRWWGGSGLGPPPLSSVCTLQDAEPPGRTGRGVSTEAALVYQFSSVVQFRRPGLQDARPPCPSPTPGVYSNSCPWNR